ncbi:MAG: kynureninase [Luteibaculaceae bacterium]
MKSAKVNKTMAFQNTLAFAQSKDEQDPLRSFRSEFNFPNVNGKQVIYFTGNSLGLQPKESAKAVQKELDNWANLAVEGHFYAETPWWNYHQIHKEASAYLVGAKPDEVCVMNTLSVNIHLLMVSFYRPTKERYKIICEGKAFPSDQYILETQVKHHGFNPDEAILEVNPAKGSQLMRTEDFLELIEKQGDEIALLMVGGVNYYTGQRLDMKTITKAAKAKGIVVGWDLAHAAGNIELELHDWGVDFASWCTYKYMNSGPGSLSGVFVHEQYADRPDLNRFAGWWGYDQETRFLMEKGFKPMKGADGWQLSNAPILALAPHLPALEQFQRAGKDRLFKKRDDITAYLEYVLECISEESKGVKFEVLTPRNPEERGTQLSVFIHGKGKEVFDTLMKEGAIVDWREPNVIRCAPVPLYTSYEDIYQFGQILKKAIA